MARVKKIKTPFKYPAAMSVEDAADYVGVSRSSMWRWITAGTLKVARIGGRTLVRRIELDRMLEQALDVYEDSLADKENKDSSNA